MGIATLNLRGPTHPTKRQSSVKRHERRLGKAKIGEDAEFTDCK